METEKQCTYTVPGVGPCAEQAGKTGLCDPHREQLRCTNSRVMKNGKTFTCPTLAVKDGLCWRHSKGGLVSPIVVGNQTTCQHKFEEGPRADSYCPRWSRTDGLCVKHQVGEKKVKERCSYTFTQGYLTGQRCQKQAASDDTFCLSHVRMRENEKGPQCEFILTHGFGTGERCQKKAVDGGHCRHHRTLVVDSSKPLCEFEFTTGTKAGSRCFRNAITNGMCKDHSRAKCEAKDENGNDCPRFQMKKKGVTYCHMHHRLLVVGTN